MRPKIPTCSPPSLVRDDSPMNRIGAAPYNTGPHGHTEALDMALRYAKLYRRAVPVCKNPDSTGLAWWVDSTLPPLEIHCYVNPDGSVEYP